MLNKHFCYFLTYNRDFDTAVLQKQRKMAGKKFKVLLMLSLCCFSAGISLYIVIFTDIERFTSKSLIAINDEETKGKVNDVTSRSVQEDASDSTVCKYFSDYGVLSPFNRLTCRKYVTKYPSVRLLLEKIHRYVLWHGKVHQEVLRAGFKYEETNMRTLTWKCGTNRKICNGYGDRIKGIAKGLLLAVLSERFYTFEWPKSYQDLDVAIDIFDSSTLQCGDLALGDLLTNKICPTCADLMHSGEKDDVIYQVVFSNNTANRNVFYNSHRIDPTCVKHTELSTQLAEDFCPFTHRSEFHNLLYGLLVRLLIRFNSRVTGRAKEISESLSLPKYYVALHIRSGLSEKLDGELLVESKFKKDPTAWQQLIQCAFSIQKMFDMKDPILLVTDSFLMKKWALSLYGRGRIVSTNINLMHVSKDVPKRDEVDRTAYEQDVIDNASDLALLSSAYVVIRSQSSGFSYVASLLGGQAQDRIRKC